MSGREETRNVGILKKIPIVLPMTEYRGLGVDPVSTVIWFPGKETWYDQKGDVCHYRHSISIVKKEKFSFVL